MTLSNLHSRGSQALPTRPRVFVNGKFLAQRTTGVQRVASALISAIDADPEMPADRFVVLSPRGAPSPQWDRVEVQRVGPVGLPLHVWEQCLLPMAARGGLLLNLAGSAPWFSGRCAAVLHDAAVWDTPESYSLAFRWWYRALFHHLARTADRLFTVSEYSQRRLSEVLKLAPGRCTVLRNGSDHLDKVVARPAVLSRLGLMGRPFLLTVGSFSPAKNLAMLAKAYALARLGPDVPLVLVGGESAMVFATTSRFEEPIGWTLAGSVDDGELRALYQGAVALLVPSRHEGFCLPAAEALREGCAVLASRSTALPELFGGEVATLPADDAGAWAAAMRRLVVDDIWRRSLLEHGRRHLGDVRWALRARQLVASVVSGES